MDFFQKSPRLIAKEVKQFAEDLQQSVDAYGMGGITGEALEAKFKKLEGNIPSLVAQFRGQNLAEDPREGDRVWVPRLSGEAIVESVSGQFVYVKPLNAGIALFSLGKSGSKSKQGIKYNKGEVMVVERASKGEEDLGRDSKKSTQAYI